MPAFDFEAARRFVAERRLALLGDLVSRDYDYQRFQDRASYVGLPFKVLVAWHKLYREKGLEALSADLPDLDEKSLNIALERRAKLGPVVDNESLTTRQIEEVAQRNHWSRPTAERWILRYRVGGLWGLEPHGNPLKKSSQALEPLKRDLGTLTEAELLVIYDRLDRLGPLAKQQRVANLEFEKRAAELRLQGIKTSARTLRGYHSALKKEGLAGLADKERSDKGRYHGLSERVISITQGVRLSKPDYPVREVYQRAKEIAQELGEPAPTEAQVRHICADIPEIMKLWADKRYDEIRSRYGITYPLKFGERIVYQMDHTQIDLLVKDLRADPYRTESGETRPYLIIILESRSRRILAWVLSYDRPNKYDIAVVIAMALRNGGIPDEIWTDQGKEMMAGHVERLADGLGFTLVHLEKHQPQQKGRVERFFGTLNTRLWATLEGYVASHTEARNPSARARYTIAEVDRILADFIKTNYHQAKHSQTKQTPLAYWLEHIFTEPVNPRDLDLLLMKAEGRIIQKTGIDFNNRRYWHRDMADLVGKRVTVRSRTPYFAPDEIEVFDDKRWLFTANAIDSEAGQAVTRADIVEAKQQQKQAARREVEKARQALQAAEAEIKQKHQDKNGEPAEEVTKTEDQPPQPDQAHNSDENNFLDQMEDLW